MRRNLYASGGGIFCLAFTATVATGFPFPAVESTSPIPVEQTFSKDVSETDPSAEPMQETPTPKPSDTALDTITAVEICNEFNDLRREILNDRMKAVDWWLEVVAVFLTLIAVVLTLMAVVAAIVGFFGFSRFSDKAKAYLKEIKSTRDEVISINDEVTSQTVIDEPAKADEAAQNALANPWSSPTDRAISTAIRLQQHGDIEKAIIKWRAVAEIADKTDNELAARAWFSIGYLHAQESRFREAIDGYTFAIRLNPGYAVAFYNRGNAKSGLGLHYEALSDYDSAIRLKPDYAKAFNNRGNRKRELGRHEAALSDYDSAIRLKPDYAKAFNNRGKAMNALGRHEAALSDYDKAIRLKSDYVDAFVNRGAVKTNLGRHEAALADYDKAIRLKPDHAEAFNGRGTAKSDLGRHEDALADYNEAIRLNPSFALARLQRAKTYFALGRLDETKQDLETARNLARAAGDEAMANTVNQVYKQLFGDDS